MVQGIVAGFPFSDYSIPGIMWVEEKIGIKFEYGYLKSLVLMCAMCFQYFWWLDTVLISRDDLSRFFQGLWIMKILNENFKNIEW